MKTFLKWCSATLLVASATWVHAADTDIYAGSSPTTSPNPNVMIVLDNSSNWSSSMTNNHPNCTSDNTKFCNEVQALLGVIDTLNSNVNVGLMMFAETGENGAYVRFAARPMTNTNKVKLKSIINGLIRQGSGTDSSGSNQPYGKAAFELFKYYGGYTTVANANNNTAGTPTDSTHFGTTAFAGGASNSSGTYRRDYDGNTRNDSAGNLDDNAFSSSTSNTYRSPITDNCQKNYLIFISNGNPSVGGDSGGTASAAQLLSNVGGNTTAIDPPNHASTLDEWTRFLFQTDVGSINGKQNVISYGVAVYDPTNNCTVSNTNNCASNSDAQMINLMQSAGKAGGGKGFLARDYQSLINSLKDIFVEIQAVNSVFAAASLPVSVNTQGTYLNQIFVGMFRPDSDGNPRWPGNLKQYQFAVDSNNGLFLADSAIPAINAISSSTGFITACAKSFWTSDSGTYWAFNPQGECSSGDPRSDSPDGNVVEKGGAAQRLRAKTVNATSGAITRTLYTCSGSSCDYTTLTASPFASSNSAITTAALGAADATERAAVINWLRGLDNKTDENSNGVTNEMRPSAHGDVVHGRPLAVNYGGSTGVVVYYGSNDGVLHAISGGQTATDGDELWGYVPTECYAIPRRLRENTPKVDFWNGTNPNGLSPAPQGKSYCFDGAIGLYQNLSANTTWIYPVMRRGGRALYAFNVSDPTQPALMWKKTNADTGYSNLGYTWSTPRPAMVNGYANPVIIMGGGYDPCWDQDAIPNTTCTSTQMGASVYVLDAQTGAVVREFTMTGMKSVAADVTLVNADNDTANKVDYAYAADLGGNVYRINFSGATSSDWAMTKIAAVGGDRRFLFAPDVVVTNQFRSVLIGSGDREHPLTTNASYAVENRFYMFKDTDSITTALTESDLTNLGTDSDTPSCTATTIGSKGWMLDLRNGEQVVTGAVTAGGYTNFSTNRATVPASGSCSGNLGEARGYSVNFLDGTPDPSDCLRSQLFAGGGLPPSPVAGTVEVNGKLYPFVIGGKGVSALQGDKVNLNLTKTRTRVYWYEMFD